MYANKVGLKISLKETEVMTLGVCVQSITYYDWRSRNQAYEILHLLGKCDKERWWNKQQYPEPIEKGKRDL